MENRTTLFILDLDTPDAVISATAEEAAQNKTHLACLLLGPAPALPVYSYGVPPYGGMNVPDNWSETVDEVRTQLKDRGNNIEKLLARAAVSGDVQPVLCATVDVRKIVARRARVCDMAYIAPNLRDAPNVMREAAYGVLFHSPIGLMVNAAPSLKADTIFVAWDSSEAAARSVHMALPYLKEAKSVTVGCFDPKANADRDGADPGADVATWLSHHGCNVTLSQYPSGGREIGQCIQDRASEIGADLVVMGAYGHSRLIEAVLGGTTRTMAEQTDLPVLFSH